MTDIAASAERYLTKVETEYVDERRSYRLLFGRPIRSDVIANGSVLREEHFFTPDQQFGLDLWAQSAHGDRAWTFYVLRAGGPGESLSKVPQVTPGAKILLAAKGKHKVQRVIKWLRTIELEVDPSELSPEIFLLADMRFGVDRCRKPKLRLVNPAR